MMNTRRLLVGAICFVGAVGAGYYVINSRDNRPAAPLLEPSPAVGVTAEPIKSDSTSSRAVESNGAASATNREVTSIPPPLSRQAAATQPATSGVLARDRYRAAKAYGRLVQQFANDPDPRARYFAQRALQDCLLVVVGAEKATIDMFKPLVPNDPLSARRLTAYQLEREKCSDFSASGVELYKLRSSLATSLATSGLPEVAIESARRAVRAGEMSPGDALSLAQNASLTGDPDILMGVAGLMYGLLGKATFVVGDTSTIVSAKIMGDAWNLAACDAGAECGQTATAQQCAFHAQCADTAEEFLQRFGLPADAFAQVQVLRQRIGASIAAGEWAPNFAVPKPVTPHPGVIVPKK